MHWRMRYPSMLAKKEEDTLSTAFCPSRAIHPPSPRVMPQSRRWSGGGRAEGRQRKPWQGDKSPRWQETNRGCFALPAGGREQAFPAGRSGMPPAY